MLEESSMSEESMSYPPSYHSRNSEITDPVHRAVAKVRWVSIFLAITTTIIKLPQTATQLLDASDRFLAQVQQLLAAECKKYTDEELANLTVRYHE